MTSQKSHGHKTRLAIGLLTVVSAMLIFGLQAQSFMRPHAPAMSLFGQAPLVVRLHASAALLALLAGALQLALPKGGARHRILGWMWAIVMLAVASSSLLIASRNGYSAVHVLTVLTFVGIPIGVLSARQRNWSRHAKVMKAVFAIGLVAGGLFNFMPGRLMWEMVFG